MSAITDGDRIERDIQRRIQRVYQKALDKSTKNIAEFLQIVAKVDSGEKQPPVYYRTDEQKALWRQGFLAQELQRLHVQELITEEIARAGAKAEGIIREATADVYLDNYAETVSVIEDRAAKLGVNASFAMPKRQEVRTLLDERNGVFSKIAYQNMGSDTYIRQKLQSEMAQATILGESQRKILERIRNVTGQSVSQAKRVAQTERNRVQSQARFDAAQAAAEQGVETYSEWRCRFVRSRDTHMARHGVRVRQGECFPGCNLRYPGDPNGSAKEVINCHCYLQVGVLLHDETLDENGNIVKKDSLQSGAGSGTIRTPKKTIAGVEQGEPMTFEEADNYHVNPKYGTDEGYSINCQTCVVAFEARLRGYDVEATQNTSGSANETLSRKTNLVWIDPATGDHPEYIRNQQATTPKKCLAWLDATIQQGQRYTIQYHNKGSRHGGHIVNIDRNESGQLRIKDNQRGQMERSEWIGEKSILGYLTKNVKYQISIYGTKYATPPSLLRVDNMEFDEAMAAQILKKAGT